MGITGGFGTFIDLTTRKPRNWYMRSDGIKRWVSNDKQCEVASETDLLRAQNADGLEQLADAAAWIHENQSGNDA